MDETTDLTQLDPHPFADHFPMMGKDEFESLKADIDGHGLRDKVVLFDGQILDGRNRYRALKALGKITTDCFEQFEGSEQEALGYSSAANMMRRHLTKSQKAMVIALNGLAAAPKGMKTHTATENPLTIRDAALKYGVNHQSVYKAFFVADKDLELAELVKSGGISVGAAARQLKGEESPPRDTSTMLKATKRQASDLRDSALALSEDGSTLFLGVDGKVLKLERGTAAAVPCTDDELKCSVLELN